MMDFSVTEISEFDDFNVIFKLSSHWHNRCFLPWTLYNGY